MPMVTITCHTSGCENDGEPIDVEVYDVDPVTGEQLPPTTFMCGPCGQEITDVESAPEQEVEHHRKDDDDG
jgi:hypothetical protein